ncbi:hypothetical protein NA57DRAFT_80147 [Rhizodiscina lignyota]|uniref:F-box domain-containing protein n=1 Tax=Rhizodiscina lignyota TaxID=1504668 RepID=A0A9P4IAH2_9PEZI|nr:hypothetical protein NA57DRAFT_80147 [Rhizodiscina lignyota]
MANLATLPLEIARRIASETTFESICSLSCASRRLRQACLDWTVFRDLLRRIHDDTSQYVSRSGSTELSAWRHWALAESKACGASGLESDFAVWGPQIIALNHPLHANIHLFAVFRRIGELSSRNAYAYAFCFAARALSYELSSDGDADAFYSCIEDAICGSDLPPSFARITDSRTTGLNILGSLWEEEWDWETGLRSWPPEDQGMHVKALKALGVLGVELKSAVHTGKLKPIDTTVNGPPDATNPMNVSIPIRILTSVIDIPFAEFMNLPVPFDRASADQLRRCHLSTMTTNEFIQDGTWTGIIYWPGAFQYLLPFELSTIPDDADADVLELKSDRVFSLSLNGYFRITLRKSSGVALISFEKSANDRFPLPWQGVLTPFGFIGSTTDARLQQGDFFFETAYRLSANEPQDRPPGHDGFDGTLWIAEIGIFISSSTTLGDPEQLSEGFSKWHDSPHIWTRYGNALVPCRTGPYTAAVSIKQTQVMRISNEFALSAVIVVGFGVVGLAVVAIPTLTITYIDCYKPAASEIMVITTVCKNTFEFGMTYYMNDWAVAEGFMPPVMLADGNDGGNNVDWHDCMLVLSQNVQALDERLQITSVLKDEQEKEMVVSDLNVLEWVGIWWSNTIT